MNFVSAIVINAVLWKDYVETGAVLLMEAWCRFGANSLFCAVPGRRSGIWAIIAAFLLICLPAGCEQLWSQSICGYVHRVPVNSNTEKDRN